MINKTTKHEELTSAMKAAMSEATIIEYLPLMEQDRELNWNEFYDKLPDFDWDEFVYELCEKYQYRLHAESGD